MIRLLPLAFLLAAWCPNSALPPARFDHPPTIPLREYPVALDQFRTTCERVFLGTVDCNWPVVGMGMRFMTPDGEVLYGAIVYLAGCERTRRHEIGHLNGWPPWHPRS